MDNFQKNSPEGTRPEDGVVAEVPAAPASQRILKVIEELENGEHGEISADGLVIDVTDHKRRAMLIESFRGLLKKVLRSEGKKGRQS